MATEHATPVNIVVLAILAGASYTYGLLRDASQFKIIGWLVLALALFGLVVLLLDRRRGNTAETEEAR